MSSLASSDPYERWEVGDQIWSRNPATGVFDLIDYRGLGAAQDSQDPLDWATLVGARVSLDDADRGDRPIALFPGDFKFSPATGKPLPEPPIPPQDAWLPPFGGESPAADRPQGLRLTGARLALRQTLSTESLPDRQLAIPAAGKYQFLVSACQTCDPRLLALEHSRGILYQWLPRAGSWQVLQPTGAEALATSSLGDPAWGMAAQNLWKSNKIFLPTDEGLAVVSVNLLAGTYDIDTFGHGCVGAPVMWRGKVYVPMLDTDGRLGVFTLQPQGNAMQRLDGPELEPATARWVRPVADRHRIVWMGSRYQLVVQRDEGATLEASLVPWARGLTPRFERAGPFLSESGDMWQQCFRRDEQGGRFVFAQVGVGEPEIRSASAPRHGTGAASTQDEPGLQTVPPVDPVEATESANEVVYPLLASTSTSNVLYARIPHTGSVDRLFSSSDTFTTTFELRGEQDVRFWVSRMSRPWATQAFVYAGHLYLYHPDKHSLPGWRMNP